MTVSGPLWKCHLEDLLIHCAFCFSVFAGRNAFFFNEAVAEMGRGAKIQKISDFGDGFIGGFQVFAGFEDL